MIGYKLFKLRRDGSFGPLFINRPQRIPINTWLKAEAFHKKGFAFRPGWHVLEKQQAPHLSKKGRVWARVEIRSFSRFKRSVFQGGVWFLAKYMRVLEILN